jgi:D-lactate dehydrogenase
VRIVSFEIDEPWEHDALRDALPGHDLVFHPHPLDERSAGDGAGAEAVTVFIHSRLSADVIARLPDLRFVAARSTGFDHVDAAACAARGIPVSNVPLYGENTVAEHAFALILNLSRKVHQAWLRTRAGDFSVGGLEGFDLNGKTLGVVGAGRIGLHVVRIARAFGMEVVAYDPAPHPLLAEVLGFRYAALDELLAESDVVSLHLPLTADEARRHPGEHGPRRRGAH